jgi:hypothetical protein
VTVVVAFIVQILLLAIALVVSISQKKGAISQKKGERLLSSN